MEAGLDNLEDKMKDERFPTMKNIKSWLTYHGSHEGYGEIKRVAGSIYQLQYSWLSVNGITKVIGTLHEIKRICRALMTIDDWDFRT